MTHYTCDRCGTKTSHHGWKQARSVDIHWPDDDMALKEVVLLYDVHWPGDESRRPDLCDDCLAHILHEVASRLDSDRVPV